MRGGSETLEAALRRRIVGFCDFLRSRGLPVGVGAEVDLGRAVDAVDLLDRRRFRAACGVTLAKSPEELRLLNAAFDVYWVSPDVGPRAPWPESDLLVPPSAKPPREHSNQGRREAPEAEAPPVIVPVGTYSATAPASGHTIRPLPERELRSLRHGARRFRRQLATLPGRRRGHSRHGTVDLRDTVRQSLRHGAEWVELRYQRPKPSRADLVILWDVSGSMREHESRFFGLAHALEAVSRSARVFAFSTHVEEITSEVRRTGYRRATATVGRRIATADGGTRIGRSLREFVDRYGATLRERTTLVILSDGWDLGEAELVAQELARVARSTHRIVWVTPYTRRPGFEPRVGALWAALGQIDLLLGPEDFESHWPLRPIHF
jgi:uncharacterized protein